MTDEEREENVRRDQKRFEIGKEISEKKKKLADSDYKVIKCYEASLMNEKFPYDLKKLIKERNELRYEINELEKQID